LEKTVRVQRIGLLATAAFLALAGVAFVHADEITGVKGAVIRLAKNKQNADKTDEVKCKVGDEIEIDYTYPIVPGAIPSAVEVKVDGEAATSAGVFRIQNHKLVGAGTFGAFLNVKKKGKATITYTITQKDKEGKETSVDLKCEVDAE
jgi:hypothetical protein